MTGVSATTSGSTVIVGVIGVVMIWLGGNAIVAGRDDARRFHHVHLLHRPAGRAARSRSRRIGTQITEAFAGLDRIREILDMQTEDEPTTASRRSAPSSGDVRFEDVWFEYNPGVPVLKGVSFQAAPGTTTALVGSSGSGKSTLISLVMAFNRPLQGARPRRRQGPRRHPAARLPRAAGVGAAGELPVRRHDRRERRLRQARARRSTRSSTRRASRTATSSSSSSRRATTPSSASAASSCRGGQRQRVSIARAILAPPADPDPRRSDVEPRQRERADDPGRPQARCAAGRTTFVIAHRLSTIRSADQILVHGGRRDRRARHARRAAGAATDATGSCTTSSTSSRPTASSTRARTSRRSRPSRSRLGRLRRRFNRRINTDRSVFPVEPPAALSVCDVLEGRTQC